MIRTLQQMPFTPSVWLCAEKCHATCCRAPGDLVLTKAEKLRLKALPGGKALKLFCHPTKGWMVIFDLQSSKKCPFLGNDSLCTIYPERPSGCRNYPQRPMPGCLFWPAGVS